ncbi:MAG: hypothetical protein GY918_12695, partial [Gammaproteobacteria bacterium]|nr:hypothetical protein [Gammaproteobacteria bacterium]
MPGSMLPNSRSSFRSVPAVGNTSMGVDQLPSYRTPTLSISPGETPPFRGGTIAASMRPRETPPFIPDGTGPFRADDPMASFPSEEIRQDIITGEQSPNTHQEMQQLSGEMQQSAIPQAAYTMQSPSGNYGLHGAEQALQAGLGGQAAALTQGAHDAFGTMQRGSEQARGDISGGFGTGLRLAQQGLGNARSDINEQLNNGLSALRGGLSTGRSDIRS